MKRIFLAVFAAALLGSSGCTHDRGGAISVFGPLGTVSLAKETPLQLLDGRSQRFADIRSKVIMLHFWASWCSTCVHELYSLHQLANRFDPRDFTIVLVAEDDKIESAARALAANPVAGVAAIDLDGSLRTSFRVPSLPYTVILNRELLPLPLPDPNGSGQSATFSGERAWDNPQISAAIRSLVERESYLD